MNKQMNRQINKKVNNPTLEDFKKFLPREEDLDSNVAFDYPEIVYTMARILLPAARLIPRLMGVDRIAKKRICKDSHMEKEVRYCLILGALLYQDGSITPVIVRRLNRAYEVYKANPHMKFVISGVGPDARYGSDVDVMAAYFEAMGVPASQIYKDYHGDNTYRAFRNMAKRCKGRRFLVVSNNFHIPRCMYIAERMGIDALGLQLEEKVTKYYRFYTFRECFAVVKAWRETGKWQGGSNRT